MAKKKLLHIEQSTLEGEKVIFREFKNPTRLEIEITSPNGGAIATFDEKLFVELSNKMEKAL